ncbi:MAG: aldose 1-epimerase [Neisseria sp.]|uniref:aldose 1-epimerase n=1 Tax=Neisseria sp. TaxID=192066 RepID=UPI0026DC1FB1|nr:aldose 1-epimerase [Neisseria sp.]MDO4249796.1 aldose 1-epimerase [Neisseria sp.]
MIFTVQTESERIILNRENHALAEIYLYGGLPNRYEIRRRDGSWFNCIAAYGSPQQCRDDLTQGFRSAKLSPYVCRMNRGGYTFKDRAYRCSKYILNGHAIHGLMYDAHFQTIGSGADENSAWAEIAADYAQDDAGFPFAYSINLLYRLDSDGLSISTTVTNTGHQAMPLADGWHPYFMLGGQADDWCLHINSSRQLEFNQDLIPTGNIIADTRFQTALSLQDIGLDNSFILDNHSQAACILSGNGLILSVYPDENYPIMQIYIPPERTSVALENLSGAPDCFNNGIGLVVLAAGQQQRFKTRYVLKASDEI